MKEIIMKTWMDFIEYYQNNVDVLRQKMYKLMEKEPLSKNQLRKNIGITNITLSVFLGDKAGHRDITRKLSVRTLIKIRNFILAKEKEYDTVL